MNINHLFDPNSTIRDTDAQGRDVIIGTMHGQPVAFTWLPGTGWVETDSPAAQEESS